MKISQINKIKGVTEKDQMNMIIKVLGALNDDDLSFLTGQKSKAFNATYENYGGKKLSSIFPSESEECLHLLKKMLEFNPYFRYSAEECLNHPYFEDIRNKELEVDWDVQPIIDPEARLTHVIHNFKLEQKKQEKNSITVSL